MNTPTKASGIGKGSASDLGFVEAATRTIAQVATGDKIVVEKSTVPCRTAQFIRDIVSPLQYTACICPDSKHSYQSTPDLVYASMYCPTLNSLQKGRRSGIYFTQTELSLDLCLLNLAIERRLPWQMSMRNGYRGNAF